MGSITDYFERIGHKPKYHLGDRISGTWNGIPWIGTAGVERRLYVDKPPVLTVMLDLPLKYDGVYYRIINVDPNDVKRRKVVFDKPQTDKSKV